jgi:hypothetical protein
LGRTSAAEAVLQRQRWRHPFDFAQDRLLTRALNKTRRMRWEHLARAVLSRGLKPVSLGVAGVRAEARIYLRSKGKGEKGIPPPFGCAQGADQRIAGSQRQLRRFWPSARMTAGVGGRVGLGRGRTCATDRLRKKS